MKQFEIQKLVTIHDLQIEIKQIRVQIEELKVFTRNMDSRIQNIENQEIFLNNQTTDEFDNFVKSITIVEKQKWYTKITFKIYLDYKATCVALIDLGANLNCIQEGLIHTVYFSKTSQKISTASNVPLQV